MDAPSTFRTHTVSWQLRLRTEPTHSFACTSPCMARGATVLTMPFGSSASVYAFLRTSLGAWRSPFSPALDLLLRRFPDGGAQVARQRGHAPDQVPVHLARLSSQWHSLQEPAVCSSVSGAWGCLRASSFWGLRGGKHQGPNPTPGLQLARAFDEPFPFTQGGLPTKRPRAVCPCQLSGRYHSRCLSSLHELSTLAPGSRAPHLCGFYSAVCSLLSIRQDPSRTALCGMFSQMVP